MARKRPMAKKRPVVVCDHRFSLKHVVFDLLTADVGQDGEQCSYYGAYETYQCVKCLEEREKPVNLSKWGFAGHSHSAPNEIMKSLHRAGIPVLGNAIHLLNC